VKKKKERCYCRWSRI